MNVSNQKFPKQSGWIFVLCSDEMRNDGTFLLSTCVAEKMNIRGIAIYHGVIAHQDKSIENLLRQHFSAISPNTKVEAQMESFFEITPDISLKFVNSQNPSIDHIDGTSEVALYQKVEVGRSHVLCEDFWSQIQLLNMIKSDILSFKNSSSDGTFADPNYNYGSSDMTFENLQVRKEVSMELRANFGCFSREKSTKSCQKLTSSKKKRSRWTLGLKLSLNTLDLGHLRKLLTSSGISWSSPAPTLISRKL